jgi:catechol 2,3-dioxygenase-like lactoylglutathione lyase family enzyme
MERPIALRLLALLVLLLAAIPQGKGAVQSVGPVEITVANLEREVHFFTRVLQFEKISEHRTTMGELDDLLGLEETELASAELKLGDESVLLSEHLLHKGRPIPADSRSYDHWFQHIAIVVSDIDQAYAHLRQHKIKHVSTGPQTLPLWNKDAGGIKAFYFCDPEDHVLEIIWFPPGKGHPKWQHRTGKLFLGIDHTAIVVADTDRSLQFYRDHLGMRVVGRAENYGSEQEHLNQVFGARLRITALRAETGPGIEFLEYISPPGGRPLPTDSRANDLLFWVTHLVIDGNNRKSVPTGPRVVSKRSPKDGQAMLVRDADGHALKLIPAGVR